VRCNFCHHENREGIYFCEECGKAIGVAATKYFTGQLTVGTDEFQKKSEFRPPRGAAISHDSITFQIGDEQLGLDLKDDLIIGRADPTSSRPPEIDLNPYGAIELGVSRRHAKIERNGNILSLIDLNSSNGTFVNGRRLASGQAYILRDGDEIRIGKLVIIIKSDIPSPSNDV
jgi:pSer/pThr/pTyr-binding forkhead associated (FHA) protein